VELPELLPVLVNLHTAVIGGHPALPIDAIQPAKAGAADKAEKRPVWFEGKWMETRVYQREQLARDFEFSGPAIIEQLDATTVVEPADRARIDSCGNVIIQIGRNA
jgi:N-methylhydantoinase A